MKTHIALCLGILYLAKGGWCASTVEGHLGDSIIIKCRYDKKYTSEKKYFCKGYYCRREVYTDRQGWKKSKRLSVYDNMDEGYLKVIMRDLTKSDEGTYWCAVYMNWQRDEYTKVNLKVRKGKEDIYRVSGYRGQTITIKCKFGMTHKYKTKYLCKNTALGCEDIIRTDKNNQWESRDRFSLYDNTTAGFLFVSISELSREDAGIYWCVVGEPFLHGSKVNVDKFKTIQMNVYDAPFSNSIPRPSKTSAGMPAPISTVKSPNHGSSAVAPVSMAIMMVMIGVVVFVWIRHRKSRGEVCFVDIRMPSSPTSNASSIQASTERAVHDDYDEELNETSFSASGSNIVPQGSRILRNLTEDRIGPHCAFSYTVTPNSQINPKE